MGTEETGGLRVRSRRPAARPASLRTNQVLVTRRHPQVVYFRRAAEVLEETGAAPELLGRVELQGLGAAVQTTLAVVQDLVAHYGRANLEVTARATTHTVVDDVWDETTFEVGGETRSLNGLTVSVAKVHPLTADPHRGVATSR